MRFLAIVFLFASFTSAHHLMGQEPGRTPAAAADSAGFTEALFDTTTLTDILKDDKAVAVRFYNVMVPTEFKEGSAMAVGIRVDGAEINSGKAYKVSLGFVAGVLKANGVASKDAKLACSSMQASGHPSYSASFTRTELETLIGLDGCQAVRATPDFTTKGETTIRLTAMKVANGKADPLGTGGQYERLCGYPCPTLCGPAKNYVYQAPK